MGMQQTPSVDMGYRLIAPQMHHYVARRSPSTPLTLSSAALGSLCPFGRCSVYLYVETFFRKR